MAEKYGIVDWTEEQWDSTQPSIPSESKIEDYFLNKIYTKQSKQLERFVEVGGFDKVRGRFESLAEPHIKRTNDKYFRKMEIKIMQEGIDKKELERIKSGLSSKYKVTPELEKIIDEKIIKEEEREEEKEKKATEKREEEKEMRIVRAIKIKGWSRKLAESAFDKGLI